VCQQHRPDCTWTTDMHEVVGLGFEVDSQLDGLAELRSDLNKGLSGTD